MYKKILIPTDGSELAGKAVQHGIAFAKETGAKVMVLTVTMPFHVFTLDPQIVETTSAGYGKHTKDHAAKILGGVANAAKAAGVACDTLQVEAGHPYKAIIEAANSNGCDLIMMASHGRRGVSAILLGSETVQVLTHTKIPVLVDR
jgi:nucleotide-binding universal stress UspA family protein